MTRYAVLAALLLAVPAQAAPCADRAAILAELAANYAERPASRGLSVNGLVVELVLAPDGRTWTLLATNPAGITCVITAGEAWQAAPIPGSDS